MHCDQDAYVEQKSGHQGSSSSCRTCSVVTEPLSSSTSKTASPFTILIRGFRGTLRSTKSEIARLVETRQLSAYSSTNFCAVSDRVTVVRMLIKVLCLIFCIDASLERKMMHIVNYASIIEEP